MEAGQAETTQDWLLPEHMRPPLIGELERRIDQAMATARASEAAVVTVGASALEAAEQARRAAELAERASAAALATQGRVESIAVSSGTSPQPESSTKTADVSLSDFSARADRLVARLRQLQRVPLPEPGASGAPGQRQPAR
jgi:hypothetical protein